MEGIINKDITMLKILPFIVKSRRIWKSNLRVSRKQWTGSELSFLPARSARKFLGVLYPRTQWYAVRKGHS
uniref:Uncharacterized protein n=1 Tax=Romanomermis culicivorax TaxID=13658 RepID=A0A915KL34_ROMCU